MWQAIGAALGSFGLDVLGGAISGHSAKQAAREQRNWEAKMSNTAMQRRVVDLKAAGLNPMLAYMNSGQGASTPSGSRADVPDLSQSGSRGVSSAARVAEMQLLKQQALSAAAMTRKTEAEAEGQEIHNQYSRALWTSEVAGKLSSAGQARMATEKMSQELQLIGPQLEKIRAETMETLARVAKVDSETMLALQHGRKVGLEADQLERIQPLIVESLRTELELLKSKVPFAENAAVAQEAWWRRVMAAMGFTQGQADWIVNAATAAAMRNPK